MCILAFSSISSLISTLKDETARMHIVYPCISSFSSHLTPHPTNLTPHTSHSTPHTSHFTPPASHLMTAASQQETPASQEETSASQKEIQPSRNRLPPARMRLQAARKWLLPARNKENPLPPGSNSSQSGRTLGMGSRMHLCVLALIQISELTGEKARMHNDVR